MTFADAVLKDADALTLIDEQRYALRIRIDGAGARLGRTWGQVAKTIQP